MKLPGKIAKVQAPQLINTASHSQAFIPAWTNQYFLHGNEPPRRVELLTYALRMRCSTN